MSKFDTAPRDGTKILAWHRVWKCWMTIKYIENAIHPQCEWVEATLSSAWPSEAFSHWRLPPESPEGDNPDFNTTWFTDSDEKISQAEMERLFGNEIPIDVAALLLAPTTMSLRQLREKIATYVEPVRRDSPL